MEVILLADVEKLGLRGDLVDVRPGYARNFLLPRRLAERATPGRVAELRRREDVRARQEARTVDQAREVADVLNKTVLRFEVKAGPTGALFGSVTPTDVVDEIWRVRRLRVDRRKVELAEPIKRVGRYEVPIDLFPDVRVDVKTLVVPEGGELPPEGEEPEPVEPVADTDEAVAAVDGVEAVPSPVAAEPTIPPEADDAAAADEPRAEPA